MVIILHKHGFMHGQMGSDKVDDAYGEFLEVQVDGLSNVVDKTTAMIKKIDKDKGLCKKNKGDRIREATSEAHDKIKWLDGLHRRNLDHNFADTERNLSKVLAVFDHNVQQVGQVISQNSYQILRNICPKEEKIAMMARAST